MPRRPSLLQAILRAERGISGPLERASNSSEAADALFVAARGARLVLGAAERARAAAVHALYLPTRRDVQALETKVERLQRALDEFSAEERDRGRRS